MQNNCMSGVLGEIDVLGYHVCAGAKGNFPVRTVLLTAELSLQPLNMYFQNVPRHTNLRKTPVKAEIGKNKFG